MTTANGGLSRRSFSFAATSVTGPSLLVEGHRCGRSVSPIAVPRTGRRFHTVNPMSVCWEAVRHSRQSRAAEDEGAGAASRARKSLTTAALRRLASGPVPFARKHVLKRLLERGQRHALVQHVDPLFARRNDREWLDKHEGWRAWRRVGL